MIRAAALLLALIATPAGALSCRMMQPGDAYDHAAASASQYAVVAGVADFDAALLPHNRYADIANAPRSTPIPARVRGQALDTNGFLTPFDREVTLDVTCLGNWCGTLVPGAQLLLFLELRGDSYALTLGPCAEFAFPDPSPETLAHVAACFQAGVRCGKLR
ncbi:hypothetical protein [Seohaeicola zhoushanensis]|uniref:Lipoprotein n=1 Tax=Seohaeicola zhoushanensis TaxID=1569283 RepID=A0A8J3H0U1_9RHOB|nr:hypothetical protein [Seohaeicola zhoushanensis]GHF61206.1 hypothetical protein GCM10017056_35800 [Seohaeicola zhoushanensis]